MTRGAGNAAIAHGGGPTAVLNASLAGVIEQWTQLAGKAALYGAWRGIDGLLSDTFVDLSNQDAEALTDLQTSPGSAIGSSRRKLAPADYERILAVLRSRGIRTFFYTGGNGSMGTAMAVERFAREAHYELAVVGIPKTIDNDLHVTDHTPGYASTARFFACAARDLGEDNRALPSPVAVLEVLGRNAGWVTAATALARGAEDDAPHLIYLPERRVSLEQIGADVRAVHARLGFCVVAVCEGQLDESGRPFGAEVDRPDVPQHRLASNLGHTLAKLITGHTGLRARSEKPGLVGRSCAPFAAEIDRREAFECGRAAVRAAFEGRSGVMVALCRDSASPYSSSTFLTPLDTVAGRERLMPLDWIAAAGNDVNSGFLEYVRPLVGDIRHYKRLRR